MNSAMLPCTGHDHDILVRPHAPESGSLRWCRACVPAHPELLPWCWLQHDRCRIACRRRNRRCHRPGTGGAARTPCAPRARSCPARPRRPIPVRIKRSPTPALRAAPSENSPVRVSARGDEVHRVDALEPLPPASRGTQPIGLLTGTADHAPRAGPASRGVLEEPLTEPWSGSVLDQINRITPVHGVGRSRARPRGPCSAVSSLLPCHGT